MRAIATYPIYAPQKYSQREKQQWWPKKRRQKVYLDAYDYRNIPG